MKNILALSIFLFLSGCMMPFQPAPTMPDNLALEEGDIILTTSGDTVSWFFTLAVRDNQKKSVTDYSHAEMVFRNENGQLMLGGVFGGQVNGAPLYSRLQIFHKFVVFRANASVEKRKKAAQILQGWLKDRKVSEAEFDYSMSYEPGKRDQLFCAGLVNEACRIAGLEFPFGPREWIPNNLTAHIEEIIDTRLKSLLDVGTIFNSQDYKIVLQWENDQADNMRIELSKKIVLYLLDQYHQGWRLKLGNEFNLFLSVFSPSKVEEQFARLRMSLMGFQSDVFAVWNRLSRRGALNSIEESELNALFTMVCDKFREEYFSFTDSVAVATQ